MTGSPLVQPAELADALRSAEPPTLLDVRWWLGGPPGVDAYRAGHLPGAVFVDLETALSGPPGPGGRHPLPSAADFTAAMRRCGVFRERPVVVYDDGDALPAARAWWCLTYFGHPDVRLLDGGFRAWQRAGLPVTEDLPHLVVGDFAAEPGQLDVLDADGAAALARDGLLLDVRTPERYRGEHEPIDPVAGHIPGAVNVPATANRLDDGRFREPAQLRAAFAEAGVDGDTAVGAYCGSGVTAAQEVLALRLAGVPAALYVGSWSDWVGDPSRPVATGDSPG
ncbi:MAG TPA: sulfurtransferase [Streptosporangiales bacterium]